MRLKEYILLKIYKRNINTKVLREALFDMASFNRSNKSENIKEELFKLDTIEAKTIEKPDNKVYEDILQNIEESEILLNNVRDKLVLAKKNELNLNIKVEEVDVLTDKKVIVNLNDKIEFFKDKRIFSETKVNDNEGIINTINERNELISNTKKNIYDINWLQPFFDFMHNHSTLVFTVGSGILLGGMLYLNSFGYINIGSLLTRIGINLFNTNIPQSSSTNVNPIHITIENTGNNTREVASGFFRKLGKKLLVVIDLYIEKLKDKRQKYG